MSAQIPSLRPYLTDALSTLPGSSQLDLYTLITPTRKHTSLFPYTSLPTSSRAKILQQEILILVSQSPIDPNRAVFVSGIEAVLYTIPSNAASILYISKVDSTGQTVEGCGSPTGPLVKAFIDYFIRPETRPTRNVRVQLFARAQSQYIFPDSSLHSGKRVLTDVKLCWWWKDVLTTVVRRQGLDRVDDPKAEVTERKCYYLFPGLSQVEADRMLSYAGGVDKVAPPTGNRPIWTYGHPYSTTHTPLYSALNSPPELATDSNDTDIFDLIPTFSDDPKARFLVELAATSKRPEASYTGGNGDGPPLKKRQRSERLPSPSPPQTISQADPGIDEAAVSSSLGSTKQMRSAVTAEEFWERMGFRQECTLNAVTGFFIVDLFDPSPLSHHPSATTTSEHLPDKAPLSHSTTTTIPVPMLARISSSLQNLDFGSTERAIEATKVLTESINGLCGGLSGEGENEGGSFYKEHVVASIVLHNPPRLAKFHKQESGTNGGTGGQVNTAVSAPVNMLQVRKKKRPAAS
ncbi:hypothetical protein FRB95_012525 [Tulasnella sp. JGI-2019a]|nr:hypothetical protein FRB95_012525 [Tulasnella sp. JGI-2019a]